MNKFWY